MKKTIKYLDNDGNYQYATVKDAGDLDKLKTKAKEDLVSAINELATNGIAAGGDIDAINNKVDQIQQQANQNADALNMSDQERQEMQQQIAQMQAEAQAKIAEMQKLAEEQNKKLQEASAELKKKADAIDVQKMQQDNAEALKNSAKALEDSLAATNEDLQKTADHLNEMEIQAGVVETSVKELQNGFESKVSSADFNEARTKLQEQETMVRQLNNELSTKASNNELDMVTQRVQKAESNIQQNAQGIKASVTKETMYKEMDDFAKYRENRLKYSRDFSNDWSLNGNDIIDDDHLFDTQHDVKSVSIRNGAYLTQTTDLDTDDMSKTFTLAMWVEKGKKPRAWYGSAELTNMKVKEDKGDYQRVYWTFVPTIVKQDIRITGDTSTQGNLIISEPKLEQSDRPSAWSTNTGDQYATTEKLAHDLKLTADKLESTITKQSEFSDRQLQDESRITQTEHGLEVANKTIVSKTDGLRQEFDGKIDATSKSLTTEYQSFTNRALGQMADGGANLILNSSFGSLKNSFDKWTNVNPKARIVTDDNGLKWVKLEQSGLTANSPIGLTSNLFRVKKGVVTIGLDIRSDNAQSIDNDNIVILESYNAEQKRVFTQEVGFSAFKITKETLSDHGPHRITYKYNQTRDDTQYMAVHILLPKNGILYATNVLARTIANGEDSGEYAPNDADLREQVVQQRTRIEQNDQAIALKADQTKVTQDIDAAKSSLSGAISKVEQRAANLEVKADGITSSVSTLSKTVDGISVGGTNLLLNTKDFTGDWYQLGSASLQDLDGRKVIHAWANWGSYRTRQVVQLEQNTDYTISADIRSLDGNSSDNTVTIYGVLDGKLTKLGDLHTNGKLSSKQQRFSTVWHNTSAGQLTTFRLEGHGGWGSVHGSIYISHIKLEKGNKPTDWSPAPEDTDSNISALESRASKLEQTDSEIKATVNSVTNDLKNGKATLKEGIMSMTDDHLETKFSSINGKIDGISVGGTNLVKTTSKNLYQQNVTGTWYYIATNDSHDRFDLTQYKGETISARAWIDKPSADAHLQIYTDNGFAVGNTIKAGQSGYSTITGWKVPTSFNIWNVPIGNGRPLTMGIKEIKIEKGNKPTDWSPAPEDTDSSISSLQARASKLEQTDSEIKATVTSVTNDLKNGRGSIKEGVLSMTDDHFSTKFSSIDNKIDGISVGGTNYMDHNLISGVNSTLSYDANSGEWTAQIANGAGGTWGAGVQFNKSLMQVPWDHAYTDSIEVYVTDPGLEWMMDINNFGVVNDSNLGGNDNDERSLAIYRPAPNTKIPTNQWYKVSFTAWNKASKNKNQTALWDQSKLLLVNNTGKTVTVKFRHPQQELGSTATDWSPASGDATSSGINILRNTTYPGGFVTFPAEWTSGQWRQASNGGSKKERWDYNGSPIGNVKGYRVESGSESRDVTVAQDNVVISANTEYTMSVFARGSGQLFMQMGFDQTWLSNSQTLSAGWTRYKFTFNSYGLTKANAYFGLKSANSWVDLIGFKLEQGNVATAWSPSPWDAQTRIDGVISKQAEFQTSIDGVKSTVSTLNNNQAKFTKFEQTDGGFKLVAGQQTLEFGGTNLLKNSDFQQGWTNWSSHGSSSAISDSRPSGLPNYVKTIDFLSNTGSSQSALVQSHIGVKAGKDYMISFWAKADAATELCVESNAIRYQPKLTTSWQYYSGKVTFQTDDRALYIYPTSKTTWVHLAGIKLEQGNVATAWSPSPWDAQTRIDGVISKQAEFQTSIDGVKSTVSTLNNNQAKFTKFEQTDGGFKLVAGQQTLEFGGTNLLKNSDFQQGWTNWSSHGSSSAISDSRPSGLPNYVKTIDFLSNTGSSQSALVQSHIGVKAGKDYMISFWAKADAATELCVESNAIRYQPKLTTSWQYYSGKVTFQTDDRALYIYPTSKTTWVHLAGIKLEQGNVATAWSPSPWDAQTRIDGVISKQAEFQTSIDGVKSTVSTLNNNQAKFTKFEQTDGGFKLVAGQQTLEFGGTNLLKNSDFQQGWTNWSSHGSSSAISDSRPSGLPNYVKTIDFLSNTGSSQSALVQSHIGVKAGKDYMISFWAKADAATELCVESNAIRYQPKLTTSWQYYSGKVTFQTDDRALYIYPTSKTTWVHLAGIKLEQGNVATAWSPELVDKTTNLQKGLSTAQATIEQNSKSIALKVDTGKVINSINTSTEGVKIDATKIQINGNTSISGTLNVPTVILKGKSGQIDLTGDNILVKGNSGSAQLLINSNELKLTNGSTSGVRITPTSIVIGNENKFFSQFSGTHMGFYYKTDKLKDLGLLGVGFDLVQQKSFGLTLFANPAKDSYGGGEFISLGYNDPNKDRSASGVSQISLYAKDVYSDDKKQYTLKGIHINDHMYIHQDIDISNKTIYLPGGGVKIKANGTQDPLFINGWNFSNSMQSDVYQPTLMAGYSIDTHGDSGISFLWNSVRTFGTLDLTGTIIRVADTNVSPQIGWVSFSKWNNEKHIALFHNNSNGVASGYAMSSDGVPVVFDTVSAAGWRGGQWAQ